uniref:toprim domain-containing protein n=1 Tax=Halomonas faecis TaxID=1562110 RepID=UPI001F09EE0C
MTTQALILCEKHSDQADKIAPALGLKRDGNRYTGHWNGTAITLVWAAGHLLAPEEPATLTPEANWRDPRSLLPLPTVFPHTPTDRGRKYLGNLKQALSQAKEVWLATDPDREGEAIYRATITLAGRRQLLWPVALSLTACPDPPGSRYGGHQPTGHAL